MGQLNFGTDQLHAISLAKKWYNSGSFIQKPMFVIGGYAGTGKSTVLNQVICEMNIPTYKIAFVTYTGKASVVLRKKGMNAYTIHRLIYNTSISKTSGKPMFRLKKRLPPNIELIVIDEFGMVPNDMVRDILTFGVPILALGDPQQIPPIFGENQYMLNADCFLTEVFRQSGDSSLLQVATDIRSNINPYTQKYNSDVKIYSFNKFNFNTVMGYDQIICSRNVNRVSINVKCRHILGKKTPLPTRGERVICKMNNFKDEFIYGDTVICLVNGMSGIVVDDYKDIDENIIFFNFRPDGMDFIIPVYTKRQTFLDNYENFGNNYDVDKPMGMEFYDDKIINDFDYGYCITCHKSQGSEWDSVLVYDDCFYNNQTDYSRWLYTAVTRAKKNVTIVDVPNNINF